MVEATEKISETEPLANPDKKKLIDQILKRQQAPAWRDHGRPERSAESNWFYLFTHAGLYRKVNGRAGECRSWGGFFLFFFYDGATRPTYDQVLPGDRLLRGGHAPINRKSETGLRH